MLQSPSQRRLERQRKVLYALISFCSVIVVLGAGYLVVKLNPNAKIVPKIPTIFVDTQDEVAKTDQATPEDATADHSDPADADNTEEPAGEDLTAGDAGNNGTSGGNTGGTTSGGNSGGSRSGTSKGTGSATGTFGGRTPTGGGDSTPVNTGSGNTGGTTSGSNTGSTNSGGNASGNSAPVVTQESINDSYRQQIQSKYHLTVKYGDENGDYAPVKRYVPVKIYDANVIYQYLRIIDSALAVYPSGFFPETMNSGMNLTIYLVKRIGGNISGLTETWGRNTALRWGSNISSFRNTYRIWRTVWWIGPARRSRGFSRKSWHALQVKTAPTVTAVCPLPARNAAIMCFCVTEWAPVKQQHGMPKQWAICCAICWRQDIRRHMRFAASTASAPCRVVPVR